ncbi:MAG: T9SS type A sorting domain-containing protein, partial [Bacteroidota bacterium]
PTRGEAVLQIGLPASGPLRAVVYDVRGREVAVVADGEHAAGWHRIPWRTDVAPGVYVVRLEAGGETRTQTMTVVR